MNKNKEVTDSTPVFLRPFCFAVLLGTICLFYSCGATYLTIKSTPDGATAYVVPKKIWDSDSIKYSNPANISDYIVKTSVTPVYTYELSQGQYVVILLHNNKTKVEKVEIDKTHRKKTSKTLDVKF